MNIEQAAQRFAASFERWQQAMPPVPARYQHTAEQALLLLWSCEVPIDGPITRRAIFSSKAWMNGVWTWDNCFHALALAPVDADLAWQQLLVAFDHQMPDGALPDTISDKGVVYGHTKPPIYGWTIRKLVELLGAEASRPYIVQLYEPLSRLTRWWYILRAGPHNLPLYYDGNDSGWDNATVFDSGSPVEGVDLATYLILQMETLAFMATMLGQIEDAQRWQHRAQEQLQHLLQYAVVDNCFVSYAVGVPTKERAYSLQLYMPIMLGKRLPQESISALKADLADGGPFLTEYGLASESFRSPKYEVDGYWRGPIWAPSTHQVVDGLAASGEIDLARQIAQRYCDMIVQSPGFYENYDALTGQGLRCPGVCWTAAVFLLLAHWLEQHQ
jgi:glycogen debranching enzyme